MKVFSTRAGMGARADDATRYRVARTRPAFPARPDHPGLARGWRARRAKV